MSLSSSRLMRVGCVISCERCFVTVKPLIVISQTKATIRFDHIQQDGVPTSSSISVLKKSRLNQPIRHMTRSPFFIMIVGFCWENDLQATIDTCRVAAITQANAVIDDANLLAAQLSEFKQTASNILE